MCDMAEHDTVQYELIQCEILQNPEQNILSEYDTKTEYNIGF